MKKNLLNIPLLFLIVLPLFQGCTSKPIDRTGFMPPVKIQIPRDAKQNKTTADFVKSSEKLMNTLSDRIEYIAMNGKELLNKNEEDLTVMDKIQMTKLGIQLLSVNKDLVSEMDKIQKYVEKKQKEGVSASDMKAYEAVEKAFEKRIEKLNNKYKKLMN
jgi:hypothetical protein